MALSLWGDPALLTDAATWAIVAGMEFNRDNTDPLAMLLRRESDGAHWQEIANLYATARWRELTGDEEDRAYVTRCECPTTPSEGGFLVSFRHRGRTVHNWIAGGRWELVANMCKSSSDPVLRPILVRAAMRALRDIRILCDHAARESEQVSP